MKIPRTLLTVGGEAVGMLVSVMLLLSGAIALLSSVSVHSPLRKESRFAVMERHLSNIDSLLTAAAVVNTPKFPSESERSPFRQTAPRAARSSKSPDPATRELLTVQGTLLHGNPFAVFRNAAGRQFVCGIGDTVAGQCVVSITATDVVLRDALGSYTLAAEPPPSSLKPGGVPREYPMSPGGRH
jgi:hypothetical protein